MSVINASPGVVSLARAKSSAVEIVRTLDEIRVLTGAPTQPDTDVRLVHAAYRLAVDALPAVVGTRDYAAASEVVAVLRGWLNCSPRRASYLVAEACRR